MCLRTDIKRNRIHSSKLIPNLFNVSECYLWITNKNPECLLYASLYVAKKITFFSYVLHISLRPTHFNKTLASKRIEFDSFVNLDCSSYQFIINALKTLLNILSLLYWSISRYHIIWHYNIKNKQKSLTESVIC